MRPSPAPSQYSNQALLEVVTMLDRLKFNPAIVGLSVRDEQIIAAARLVARVAADDRKAFNEARYHDAAHLIYAPDKPGAL